MRLWPASVRRAGRKRAARASSPPLKNAPSSPAAAERDLGEMDRGAAEMQRRLEQARVRLKDTIPPQEDEAL